MDGVRLECIEAENHRALAFGGRDLPVTHHDAPGEDVDPHARVALQSELVDALALEAAEFLDRDCHPAPPSPRRV
jgi:hypothetical protein